MLGYTPHRQMDKLHCIPMPKVQRPEQWPCPHCSSIYHFPDCCPFRINTPTNPPNRQLPTIGAIANLDPPLIYQTLHSTTLVNNHCPPSVGTSTSASAVNPIVQSVMSARSVQDNTPSVLASPTFGAATTHSR